MDDGDSRSASPAGTASVSRDDAPRLVVEIVEDDGDWRSFAPAEELVTTAAGAVAWHPGVVGEPACATVALSSDDRVQGLNASYRGKDKPTNVLSFPAPQGTPSGDDGRTFLGDVVLAAETVEREARELGIPPAHHLQHLVVHGLLHLVGYDHETDADAEVMEALETRILASIGIADPYGDSRT